MSRIWIYLCFITLLVMSCGGKGNLVKQKEVFKAYDASDRLICMGELRDGIRVGSWEYSIGECIFHVFWKERHFDSVSFIYPESWRLDTVGPDHLLNMKGLFCNDSNQVVISRVNLAESDPIYSFDDIEQYAGSLLASQFSELIITDKRLYNNALFIAYDAKISESTTVSILNLHIVRDRLIYDIMYYYIDGNHDVNRFMFFELCTNIKVSKREILSIEDGVQLIDCPIDSYETKSELLVD